MNRTEQMCMCLAEAGFVEGRDFTSGTNEDGLGWRISWSREQDTPELLAAVLKAANLIAADACYG